MSLSPDAIAFIGSGTVILMNVVGWAIAENRNKKNAETAANSAAQKSAVEMANLNNKLDVVQVDVTDIKHTLGNGGYTGIKGDIKAIQLNCAKEMAEVRTMQANCTKEMSEVKSEIASINGHQKER